MSVAPPESPSGFLVLDKPAGISSARALNAVKFRLPRGMKVGHAGTLDPFATGVLVVLVGRATKQCERVMGLPKGYEATLKLGATTATLDPESPEVITEGAQPPSAPAIERVLGRFVGDVVQVPPAFSAVKVSGRRAYELARGGSDVQVPPRSVRVDKLRLISYDWPTLQVELLCGRGFYVRSLARDIGTVLGTGAYLTALRRTVVGPFQVEAAAQFNAHPLTLLPLDWLEHASSACTSAPHADAGVGEPARRL